ncbi:MAG: TonB-dependent receptor [Candidatus Zhuqueibacterota bacterium]
MVKKTHKIFRKIRWLGFFLTMPYLVFAGTTGKIAGVVKDRQTNEPLAMVNIQLKGTYLGAGSDIHGNYFIISVPPGEYTVIAKMMGYAYTEVQHVKVSMDQTTRVDFVLDQEVLDLGESVIVQAERPVIQKDLTTSVEVVGLEEIEQSTATEVIEAVNLQTGVFFDPIPVEGNLSGTGRGEPRYSVRGGDQDEVVWYIDGMRSAAWSEATADAGGSYTRINKDAVKEVQVITGGFNAEYGQAQSGIVNVITKEGDQKYTFSMDYQYNNPHQRHFGDYLFDPARNIEFIKHTITDSLGNSNLDPAWWIPDRQKQVYDYRDFADHEIRFSLGGPVIGGFLPIIGDELKKMTFFLTGRYQQQPYELPRPRDTRNLTDFNLSGNYAVGPGMNIKFGGMYSHDEHATNAEESFPLLAKYYRGYGSLLDNYVYQGRLGLTHVISPNMFYELKLSSYTLKQDQMASSYRVLGESLKPDVWGWHRYDGFEDEPFIAHQFTPLVHNRTSDLSLVGHLNWQFNANNLLKSGFEFHYNTFDENSWVMAEWSDDLADWRVRGLNETYHPIQFACYVQDKMEFESMILNMGLRYDMYDGNRDWFTVNSFQVNPSLNTDYVTSLDPDKDGIDSLGNKKWDYQNVLDKERERVKPSHSLNPRIGISFPITEKSVFHFSYGHFYQMPAINAQYDFAYFRPVSIIKGAPSTDSDPERVINMTLEPLKPEKTIQFEMGIKHHIEDIAVLNITGFYKDVFDQTERAEFLDKRVYGWDPYSASESRVFYSSRYSGDYGDARGVEVSAKTLFSKNIIIDVNYSFSKSTFGKATPWQIHVGADGNVTYQWYVEASDRLPTEKSYSRPHLLRANFFMQYPDNWNIPGLSTVLGNTDLSLLYQYISGQSFTYLEADDPPDLLNNRRFPARQTWDLKFNKYLTFGQHTVTLYTKITNLFNQKNVRAWGNLWDLEALEKFVETGETTPIDPDGYNISYSIYYAPRSIWFGLKYNFR